LHGSEDGRLHVGRRLRKKDVNYVITD